MRHDNTNHLGYKQAMRMWQSGLAALIWGFAVGLLLWGSGLDVALQLYLADNVPVWLDKTARIVSDLGLGRNQVLACLALGLFGAFRSIQKNLNTVTALKQLPRWVLGCFHQLFLLLRGRFSWSNCWQGVPIGPRLFLLAVPVFAIAGLLNIFFKLLIGRPRPKEILWNNVSPYQHLPFSDAGYMSFPSGHTATTAALAVVVAHILPPRWRWVAWLWVALVASARVLAVTPHYLGDVIAGTALGVVTALVILRSMGVVLKGTAHEK